MSTITLPNIRVSSDLTVRVRLKDGGVAIDWSTLTGVKAYLYADEQRSIASRCAVSVDEEDSTLLVCQYAASKPQYLGVNRIIVCATYMGETKNYDKPALNFVRWTADQAGEQITIDDPDVDVDIEVDDVSSSILQEAIDAALQAAADAEEAAHLVPLQVLQDCVTATGQAQDATTAANAAADAANAAGITQVEASVDANVGTPSVDVDLTNKKLTLGFHNMKGIQGETGATPDISIGEVTTGAAGSQAAATMTGTAAAPVLNLTIPKGDKGDQGNSGYQGAAGELEVVNNLTDGGSTAALSAEMGKTLKGEVTQLEAKVDDLSTGKYYGYFAQEEDLPEADVDGFAYVGEGPTYTIYNLRSGVWTSSDITVNQSPIGNDEDIDQNEDGKLQFANRTYNAQQPNGMGYKILRKDATFASQVTVPNTIYEIRYPFVLSADFTMPSECELRFNGGSITGAKIHGAVKNNYLSPEWFGAKGDGTTDDSDAIERAIILAIASGATVHFNATKTYAITTSKTIRESGDAKIDGCGAKLLVSGNASFVFDNLPYYTGTVTSNITRGAAEITFGSLPSVSVGDVLHIASSESGESSSSGAKRMQTTRVGRISGSKVYLTDILTMDYNSGTTTVQLFHPKEAILENITIDCQSGAYYQHWRYNFYSVRFNGVQITGKDSSYGIVLNGVYDGIVRNSICRTLMYGYLANTCSHLVFDGIHCPAIMRHPVAIAAFSNFIKVRNVSGIGALVEAHMGFNIEYEDCDFVCSSSQTWTLRAVGVTMRNCKISSYDGNPVQPVLISSVSLYDNNIYNDYDAVFEDCSFEMDAFAVTNANIVKLDGCAFLPGTIVTYGASGANIFNKGIIERCSGIVAVNFRKSTHILQTDKERFDAVLDENTGTYIIRSELASVDQNNGNGIWSFGGYILPLQKTGNLTLPVKVYPEMSGFANTGSPKIYMDFYFTVYAANASGYAEKRYKAVIYFGVSTNAATLLRVEDLSPTEEGLSATVDTFAFEGNSVSNIPNMHNVSFNINITPAIPYATESRLSVKYNCKCMGVYW